MRILFLSAWFPLPADNGSKLRINHLLRGLAANHSVDLLTFAPEAPSQDALHALRTICSSVEALIETPFAGRAGGGLLGLFSLQPRSFAANHSPAMAAAVRARAAQHYDAVIASELHMAPYALQLAPLPLVLEGMELARLRDQYTAQTQPLARLRYGLTWLKTRAYAAQLLRQLAGATVVSEGERALLAPLTPPDTHLVVVPNGVDTSACVGVYATPQPDTLIYPGALSYDANYDAVQYFASAILPRLRAQRPNLRLRVTGRSTPEQISALATPGLEFTGYLDDVRPAVASAWAEVVPLRKGSGTRLKVLEALALGTPVIATSKGIEGLDLRPERELLLADTPDQFVAQTLRLLEQPALRQELSDSGRHAAARYDWSASVRSLENLLSKVTNDLPRGTIWQTVHTDEIAKSPRSTTNSDGVGFR